MFLEKGKDPRHARAYQVVTRACAFTKPRGRGEKHWHREQRHQRQAPIHISHNSDNGHDHDQVAKQVGNAGGQQFVQRVNVGGQPRHDATNRIAIVISHLLVLQLVIDLATQIEHYVLADTVQKYNLKVRKDKSNKLNADVQQRKPGDPIRSPRSDVPVDGVLRKLRL